MADQEGTVTPAAGTPPEGTPPKGQEPQKVQATPNEVETLRKQLAEIEKQHKSLQKTHQRTVEEGRANGQVTSMLEKLQTRFDELEMNQAVLLDNIPRGKVEPQMYADETQPTQGVAKRSAADILREQREIKKREAEIEKLKRESIDSQVVSLRQALEDAEIDFGDLQNENSEAHQALIVGAKTPAESMARIPGYLKRQAQKKQQEEAKVKAQEESEKKRKEAEASGALAVTKAASVGTTKRGIKPTVEQLRAVDAMEWKKKIDSGEWIQ